MAGRPKQRELARWIEEQGGDAVIFDRYADGASLEKIGQWVTEHLGFGSRRMIYSWIREGGDLRMAAYKDAQRVSAEAMVEKGRQGHEDLAGKGGDVTSAEVSAVRNRGEWYRWEAGKRDKDTFGDGPSVGQAVADLGGLFLNALQSHGRAQILELDEGDDMATPRMQRKLAAAAERRAAGEPVGPEVLAAVVDGEDVEVTVEAVTVEDEDGERDEDVALEDLM